MGTVPCVRSGADYMGTVPVIQNILPNHLSRSFIDGGLAYRIIKPRQRKPPDTLASAYLKLSRFLNLRPHLDAVRHVRVVAGLFYAIRIPVAIAHSHRNRLAIRQQYCHFRRRLAIQQLPRRSNRRRRCTRPRRQPAMQREKLRQQLFHRPPQSVRSIDH